MFQIYIYYIMSTTPEYRLQLRGLTDCFMLSEFWNAALLRNPFIQLQGIYVQHCALRATTVQYGTERG